MVKVILIIGGTSGIGKSLASLLEDDVSWKIIVASRRIDKSYEKNNVEYLNIDLLSEKSVAAVFNYIEKKYKKLNALINSAGYVEPRNIQEISLDEWNKTINVNLTGVFLTCKKSIPILERNKSHIVNIASTAASTPRPGWSAYAASKSAVVNFTLSLAEEVYSYGIKCHVLSPGRTATPLRRILAPLEDPTEIMQAFEVAKIIKLMINGDLNLMEGQDLLIRQRF